VVLELPPGRPIVNPTKLLREPAYLWKPSQIWRRLRRASLLERDAVRLAWGVPITIEPRSHIGTDILNHGVYDCVVPEVLLRLTEPGELAIDVGANIGQNTSILAFAAGRHGRVIAFEPGPRAGQILARNVLRWLPYELAPITVESRGLSREEGTADLHPSTDLGAYSLDASSTVFQLNRGNGATLEPPFEIEVVRLDSVVGAREKVGVLKIDVEGHEAAVLEGAGRLLSEGRVRDIVFEDYEPQPSAAVRILEAAGFTVFGIIAGWSGPVLVDLADWPRLREHHPPNFVGTRCPDRVRARLGGFGWRCLRATVHRRAGVA